MSPNGGAQPRWSADGRELFYRASDTVMAVPVRLVNGDLSIGEPASLFRLPLAEPPGSGTGVAAQFVPLPDGRFIVNLEERPRTSTFYLMTNWQRLLK